MKKLFIAALITVSSLLQAQDEFARIDITQEQKPEAAVLIPGTVEGGELGNCSWFPSEEERNRIITSSFPATSEWKNASFSFTPTKDVNALTIVLLSQGTNNPPLLFANLKIEGAELKNGNFESGLSGWWMNTAQDGSKAELASNACNGANAVNVNEPHRIAQSFKAKGGSPVKISFSYKLGK